MIWPPIHIKLVQSLDTKSSIRISSKTVGYKQDKDTLKNSCLCWWFPNTSVNSSLQHSCSCVHMITGFTIAGKRPWCDLHWWVSFDFVALWVTDVVETALHGERCHNDESTTQSRPYFSPWRGVIHAGEYLWTRSRAECKHPHINKLSKHMKVEPERHSRAQEFADEKTPPITMQKECHQNLNWDPFITQSSLHSGLTQETKG